MGKQGPCCHCGISTTPLWRNGPPEKPVLCNACGSRWRTKGTLLNYMPMHSGGFGAHSEASGDLKWSRGKKGSQKHAEQRSHKRKEPCDGPLERETAHFIADQLVSKRQEEEVASRSCSGSVISGSEGSVRRSSSSTGDLPVLGPPWDAPVPSKKRSATVRHPAPIDKLTKSLTSLLLDPGSVGHPVPSLSSEALLVEYHKPSLVAVEIGLGGVFVRQPLLVPQESESETSSFLVESKGNESFSAIGHSESGGGTSLIQSFNGGEKGLALRGKDKAKQVPRKLEAGRLLNEKNLIPNKALLENFPYNKRDVLQSCQSPLVFLEMKDIVNFDTFTGLLTEQEQVYLMQFVSSADVARIPESLKSMFSSAQFEGALTNFQQLVSEGMFDSSELGLNPRVLQHYQQLLNLTDLTGSGWMERCSQLQNRSKRRGFMDCTKVTHNKESIKDKLKGTSLPGAAASASGGSYGLKPLSGNPYEQNEDFKIVKTNGFPLPGTGSSSLPTFPHNINPVKHGLTINPEIGRPFNEAVGVEPEAKSEVTCFPGNSSFPPTAERGPTDGDEERAPTFEDEHRGPMIMDDEYMDIGGMDSGEVDSLLFDVPNPMSFQQAELLHQPSWSKTKSMKEEENDASQLESGGLIMSNTWHMDTSPAEWSVFWNSSCVGPGRALPNGAVLNPGRMLM